MAQVVLNTFKAEGDLKYCYLSRQQQRGMLTQEVYGHCQWVLYDFTIERLPGIEILMNTFSDVLKQF